MRMARTFAELNQSTPPLTFLRALKKRTLLLVLLVDFDDFWAREQLHDHAGRNNWRNAQLHEGSPVGSQDDAHPVEGVSIARFYDSVEGDLAADQVQECGEQGPENARFELDLGCGVNGRKKRWVPCGLARPLREAPRSRASLCGAV